jgi:hypothetical protein
VNDLGREPVSGVADFLHPLGYSATGRTASPTRRDNAPARTRRDIRLQSRKFLAVRQRKSEAWVSWLSGRRKARVAATAVEGLPFVMATMRALSSSVDEVSTKPNHPWTNGQVERMNRTIKDATVKRHRYEFARRAHSASGRSCNDSWVAQERSPRVHGMMLRPVHPVKRSRGRDSRMTTPSGRQSREISPPSWPVTVARVRTPPNPSSSGGAVIAGPPRSVHVRTRV